MAMLRVVEWRQGIGGPREFLKKKSYSTYVELAAHSERCPPTLRNEGEMK